MVLGLFKTSNYVRYNKKIVIFRLNNHYFQTIFILIQIHSGKMIEKSDKKKRCVRNKSVIFEILEILKAYLIQLPFTKNYYPFEI